ncbi:hypothetical protein COL154_002668 [Colletotrichum chrysophilum]|uniref:uncharacterized protein n=1 Tax=Colletotrichum chrysophilum TaxID=1836956 RepID=UPI002300F7A3|nr:uncharacterized protein COL26b_002120 [Colletotrichum chrysophilum]KAJ0348882.1 hypothetical protein KNSL1_005116 [Colletotrichum chrysophilum]KAJ0368384.1 hypothetical protein COL154_002668 [Colletotrichum chrysophilum]KAJ0379609.1 hypothetical protein COL26b_002120 [Colletotrichum chrysophilum]
MADASEGAAPASAPEESPLGNLGAMFKWRYNHIWKLYGQKKYEEAEAEAMKMLMEPRLGDFHRAGMHLLLAGSPHDYVNNAKQAVRLYGKILEEHGSNFSPKEQSGIQNLINRSNQALEKALRDQSDIERNVREYLPSGKTIDDLHDEQMKELQEREMELARVEMSKEEVALGSQVPPSSQSVPDDAGAARSSGVGGSQSADRKLPMEMDEELPTYD